VGLGLKLLEKWKEVGSENFDNIYIWYNCVPASLYNMTTDTVYQSCEVGMACGSHGRNKKLISRHFSWVNSLRTINLKFETEKKNNQNIETDLKQTGVCTATQ